MLYMTAEKTRNAMIEAGDNWVIPLMDFVDEMRRSHNTEMIRKPFKPKDERMDSILASTIEYICHELGMEIPDWVWEIPSCQNPWFVSGIENLKAIAIAESPSFFRRRKIFVLENFLFRV
ncbi:hypothetical protein JW926_18450 [Candidatus Sumerlaeota bacterium]|nr:hypothetical protein [Candidatus Sumerlaeota bacterium]